MDGSVSVGGIDFAVPYTSGTAGSTLSGGTLNFTAGAKIRTNDNRWWNAITSAITGSPAVETANKGAGNTYRGLAFEPGSGTVALGNVLNPTTTIDPRTNDKAGFQMGGSTHGNTVGSIDYTLSSDRYADVNKTGSGTWTTGNINTGTVRISGGKLAVNGTLTLQYGGLIMSGTGVLAGDATVSKGDRRSTNNFVSGTGIAPGHNGIGTITFNWGSGGTPTAAQWLLTTLMPGYTPSAPRKCHRRICDVNSISACSPTRSGDGSIPGQVSLVVVSPPAAQTPPTPNPTSFATPPEAISTSAIAMTAATASDPSSPVEYYFTETSGNAGGTDSGWQTGESYTDTGLNPGTTYSYTVTTRDALGNTGTPSAPASAKTQGSSGGPLTGHGSQPLYVEPSPEADGYKFTTLDAPLEVIWLGLYDAPNDSEGTVGDDLLVEHRVSIWRESDQALMAQTVVRPGNELVGVFRGRSVTPVTLDPNTAYVIAADYAGSGTDRFQMGNDLTGWELNGISIQSGDGRYGGPGGGMPTNGEWSIMIGPTFGYTRTLSVTLDSPTDNQAYPVGSTITVTATVAEPGPFDNTVTFHVTPVSPAGATVETVSTDTSSPFLADLGALPVGTYEIYATVVNDNDPADTATSATHTFTVEATIPTTTLVIDLGTSQAGTFIEGGQFIGSGPANLPLPELPPGSILRSIAIDASLDLTSTDNFASDLALLLDPTAETPGGDFALEITNGLSPFGATVSLGWPTAADAGPITALSDTKTAAAWAAVAPIDLATTGLFLGNAYDDGDPLNSVKATIPSSEGPDGRFRRRREQGRIPNGIAFFLGVNNGNHSFTVANPDGSGGFVVGVNSNSRTRFVGAAEGAFGTGNVTIGNFTDLQINNNNAGAGNAIDDGAALALEGRGRDQSPGTKLIMNGSKTVNLLTIDGFAYPAGTYGRVGLGGVDYELGPRSRWLYRRPAKGDHWPNPPVSRSPSMNDSSTPLRPHQRSPGIGRPHFFKLIACKTDGLHSVRKFAIDTKLSKICMKFQTAQAPHNTMPPSGVWNNTHLNP